MTSRLAAWRERAARLRLETYALYLAYRDRRVPWYARAVAVLVAAYAFSPIDLVPDFVPVLGHLDDLVLVPLGVALALKMIPPQVMADSRARAAEELAQRRPKNWIAGAVIVGVWVLLAAVVIWWIRQRVRP